MPQWSPQTYLQFADERSRPFVDLLARVPGERRTIVDLGCGPGHLTALMRSRWPAAEIVGVDSSPEMIATATAENTDPGARYVEGAIGEWFPDEPVDLIISNAAFQWVPAQLEIVPRLREHLTPGGVLAFQVPNNFRGPSHVLLRELAAADPYARYAEGAALSRGVTAATYLDLLAGPGWTVDAWETTYLHVLAGEDAVFGWMSGTGARPVLQALPDELRPQFVEEYRSVLREAYPRQPYGTVLPFPRVFVVVAQDVV
ncbi:methyltransferase domain-containing protein [Nakamurella deserti]|uniref:methyltransferase domain-containing protein n=1 Tax=Nakamurella deserti TaxID=2164074 RepID=UPI000DBE1E57|nr:methyltransferase domain-containing protein [Nakamurella deserti]